MGRPVRLHWFQILTRSRRNLNTKRCYGEAEQTSCSDQEPHARERGMHSVWHFVCIYGAFRAEKHHAVLPKGPNRVLWSITCSYHVNGLHHGLLKTSGLATLNTRLLASCSCFDFRAFTVSHGLRTWHAPPLHSYREPCLDMQHITLSSSRLSKVCVVLCLEAPFGDGHANRSVAV